MKRYLYILNGFIVAVGTDPNGTETDEATYNKILQLVREKPPRSDTTDYRLRTDLTWEPYTIEPPETDPDVGDAEALEILLGGAV